MPIYCQFIANFLLNKLKETFKAIKAAISIVFS